MRVFLTGASSGIGAALARHYAARGATLGLAARRETQLAVADLAAVQPGRSGPAYDHWEALGFTVGYRRAHYVRERAASGQAGRDP